VAARAARPRLPPPALDPVRLAPATDCHLCRLCRPHLDDVAGGASSLAQPRSLAQPQITRRPSAGEKCLDLGTGRHLPPPWTPFSFRTPGTSLRYLRPHLSWPFSISHRAEVAFSSRTIACPQLHPGPGGRHPAILLGAPRGPFSIQDGGGTPFPSYTPASFHLPSTTRLKTFSPTWTPKDSSLSPATYLPAQFLYLLSDSLATFQDPWGHSPLLLNTSRGPPSPCSRSFLSSTPILSGLSLHTTRDWDRLSTDFIGAFFFFGGWWWWRGSLGSRPAQGVTRDGTRNFPELQM
jgi:hypothetical protein